MRQVRLRGRKLAGNPIVCASFAIAWLLLPTTGSAATRSAATPASAGAMASLAKAQLTRTV